MSIQLDEGTIKERSRPGPSLYFRSAMPEGSHKAVLGMIHGYADHGARYAHVMGALADHGIGSVAIDMRGHGRALGKRGFCESFDEFLDDARELRRLTTERAKGKPAFLFGHSFGGLVATMSALDDPSGLSGLMLTDPFFRLALDVPRVKILAGKIASRIYPELAIPSGLAGKDMTHDVERARAYDNDALAFKKATARWYTETTAAQERALATASRLALPVFMAFGTADRVASMTAGKKVFDAFGSTDKTWVPREGHFHEVLNEPSWKELADAMAKWLESHL